MLRSALMLLMTGSALFAELNLMPMPASVRMGEGALPITRGFTIACDVGSYTEPRLDRAIQRVAARIGMPASGGVPAQLLVRVAGASKQTQSLDEDESYRLNVDSKGALIIAPNPLGAMHGLETFYQLITKRSQTWSAPAVIIEDHPRFAWRGLHLDVSRHFMPLPVVRRNLDGMAAVKLNVFHWHLSDDQGFRIESKRFPKLQEQGSDGLFYTQEEVRGIIEYARDRGIRVVPEFDIPGHSTSWLVGYPELGSAPGPYKILRTWGISDPAMDPAKPEVYTFLDSFIGEMASLFPDPYFHIGGDEVNGKAWAANTTDIPAFMAEHGFKTQHDLQAYFNQQVLKIVTKYGKRMEGWDEILNPALPKDIVIQSWRGAKSLAEAAAQGYQGILSSGYYLDHIEPASKLYLVDPVGNGVLGGEVCMWAEYVSPENVDSRIWPRTAAIAERFWSPADLRDIPDMYRRLEAVDAELDLIGLKHNTNYLAMLKHLAGSGSFEQVKTLADVVQPGALGLRHRVNPNYQQNTPLDRLVDAARPDPPVARRFSDLVDRYVANPTDATAHREIDRWLRLWAKNKVTGENAPVSSALARIATLALTGKTGPEMQSAQKPIGEVSIAVAPAIAKLVGARP